MRKTSYGLVLGTLLTAIFSGYGSGCSDDTTQTGTCIVDGTHAPGYVAPIRNAGRCSEAQLAEFKTKCTGDTASDVDCKDFSTKYPSCDQCLIPPENVTDYAGAYLYPYPNAPGYMSLIGASQACVTAYHGAYACNIVACQVCGTTQACNEAVLKGQCKPKYDAFLAACTSASDKAALSTVNTALNNDLVGFLRAFCGTPLPGSDGGTDGSTDASDAGDSSSDGSSSDASFDAADG